MPRHRHRGFARVAENETVRGRLQRAGREARPDDEAVGKGITSGDAQLKRALVERRLGQAGAGQGGRGGTGAEAGQQQTT